MQWFVVSKCRTEGVKMHWLVESICMVDRVEIHWLVKLRCTSGIVKEKGWSS